VTSWITTSRPNGLLLQGHLKEYLYAVHHKNIRDHVARRQVALTKVDGTVLMRVSRDCLVASCPVFKSMEIASHCYCIHKEPTFRSFDTLFYLIETNISKTEVVRIFMLHAIADFFCNKESWYEELVR